MKKLFYWIWGLIAPGPVRYKDTSHAIVRKYTLLDGNIYYRVVLIVEREGDPVSHSFEMYASTKYVSEWQIPQLAPDSNIANSDTYYSKDEANTARENLEKHYFRSLGSRVIKVEDV